MRPYQFLAIHLAEKDSALAEEAEDYRELHFGVILMFVLTQMEEI